MPKRNRTKEQRTQYGTPSPTSPAPASSAPTAAENEQARAARLFADSVRAHEAADRVERERRAAEADHGRRHEELLAAKESAAAAIRRLRADGRPRAKMAEAEASYRSALAELNEFETGERPHWAPKPIEVVDEAMSVADADADASVDQPE
ncbi:MAG: hypothetical protein JWM34_1219 [Ilumatobacteraceae bacterium]|nr:hypothetical protein [Ilumatobacteraceae bacterium]